MDDPRWLDADEQRTWRAFLLATRLLFDRFERDLQRSSGMPMAYYEVLVRLSESPGQAMRMSDLADLALSSRSRLSHAVARLEEAGWVERQTCDHDRRGSYAVLTPAGLAALRAAAVEHVACVRVSLFDALAPEQVDQLRAISEGVLEHLAAAGVICPTRLGACRAVPQEAPREPGPPGAAGGDGARLGAEAAGPA